MRTTLDLDDHLMRRVRRYAAESGRTLTSIIELGLRELLEQKKPAPRYRFRWVPVPGGTRPGVDLADRDALFDRMEGRT